MPLVKKGKRVLILVAREGNCRKDILEVFKCELSVAAALRARGHIVDMLYLRKKAFLNRKETKENILAYKPDCVFNLFEGFADDTAKEIELARIIEEMNIPFTGNPSLALKACLNKSKVKKVLASKKILSPAGICVNDPDRFNIKGLKFPVFVKPCCDDASNGIDKRSLVYDPIKLSGVVKRKFKKFPEGLVVEEFICGKEYSVGLIGKPVYEVLGVSCIDYKKYGQFEPFLTHDSKWEINSSEYHTVMPSLNSGIETKLRRNIIEIARRTAMALGCRGYMRVDMREQAGKVYVLDVNPNPDINKDSGFARQAASIGYSYPDIIEKILFLALFK